jgi:phage shock protein PspC (stress-responsive transcriptional regulator)
MQRVITINLNGHAYQLDESAYDALRAYLNLAETQLKDNPDRTEILADFEQAIAEKCGRFLGPNKTVVTAVEMQQIVTEMGPVEGSDESGARRDTDAAPKDQPSAAPGAQKRLYRIREGAMWAGVCNGVAAYLGVDVVFVRIIFAFLTAVSFGWGVIGYWILAFIIPEAHTSDEHAAAHGQPPFNAQELIDLAKKTAADLRDSAHFTGAEWKRQWREQGRQWRAQHRAWRRQWRAQARTRWAWPPIPHVPPPPAVGYPGRVWAGLLLPLFSLVSLVFVVLLLFSVVSLVNTGAIYGWALPDGLPLWAGILILVMLFQLVTAPIRAARHASYYAWGRPYGWFAAWDGLFATGFTILVIWLVLRHMPPVENVRDFMQHLPDAFRALGQDIRMWFRMLIEELK